MTYSKDIRVAVAKSRKTLKHESPKRDNKRNL